MRPKIVWIVDVYGWAYYNRAVSLLRKLPDYEHLLLYSTDLFSEQKFILADCDIVVCPDPRLLPLVSGFTLRIVQNLNAIKIWVANEDSTIGR